MNSQTFTHILPLRLLAVSCLLFTAGLCYAQTPVDDDGNPIGTVYSDDAGDDSVAPVLSPEALETLVGPIALYPDDLLAVVLPASTYPLEIVQAARFLDELENDSSLKPDESWDDSVVALLNYPEVVEMMSDDLDWTWRLGEAVVAQQNDVVAAVEAFRDRAYAAGNLKTDDRQRVTRTGTSIEIEPIDDDVIYVPYYEPEVVVLRQPARAYHYYPSAYPVYYYPYPAGYHFNSGLFWGVTTAYQIGWSSHYLHVQHHSYLGHPYYGRSYYDRYYWRRPSIQVFHTYYGRNSHSNSGYRNQHGDYWRPRHRGGARPGHYESRTRYYSDRRRSSSNDGYAGRDQSARQTAAQRRNNTQAARRDLGTRPANRGSDTVERRTSNPATRRNSEDSAIRFRSRSATDNARIRSENQPVRRQSPAAQSGDTRRSATAPRQSRGSAATERRNGTAAVAQRRNEQARESQRSEVRQRNTATAAPSFRSRTESERNTVSRPRSRPEVTRRDRPSAPARAESSRSTGAVQAPRQRAQPVQRQSPRPRAQPTQRQSQPQRNDSAKPSRNNRSQSERGSRRRNQ
ncbi:MAG: DUF3300 domain-containing protein [Woeseia sp.]